MENNKSEWITFAVTPEKAYQAKIYASLHNVSRSQLMRLALDEILKRGSDEILTAVQASQSQPVRYRVEA